MTTLASQGEPESEDMQFYSFMLKHFNEISTQSILQRCAFFSKEYLQDEEKKELHSEI